LDFRRNFGERELEEWKELIEKLVSINLTEESDKVTWNLEVREFFFFPEHDFTCISLKTR
jgi:hypothetical protein